MQDDPLQPLRTMADRVGKEVEKFAERVDNWHTHKQGDEGHDPLARYHTTLRMVNKFKEYADATVESLKQHSGAENQGELAKSVQRRIRSLADTPRRSVEVDNEDSDFDITSYAEPTSSTVRELRQWQAEAATWDLVRIIIELYHSEPDSNKEAERKERLEEVGEVYRYSSPTAIWDRFILEDDQAKEKLLVLKWLENTADSNESNIESITGQLEEESGKDTNSWTSGWLDTKSKIKNAKRMRQSTFSNDLAPIKSNDGAQLLVNQLDPDAPGRQRRNLEKSDDYYERAIWMACYEMLRRGTPWDDICEWCRERNESWRAISMGVVADVETEARTCLTGPSVGFLWRRMCFLQARGAQYRYECAVYGLLSGDLKAVEPVCRTWDDYLYARYNSLLLSRFDGYLQKNYPLRVPSTLAQKFPAFDAVASLGGWENASRHVVDSLKQHNDLAAQSTTPVKLIQGSLIGGTFKELVYNVGVAISQMARGDDRPTNLVFSSDTGAKTEEYYSNIAKDPHALRILVHLWLIFRRGFRSVEVPKNSNEKRFIENTVTYYIELLRLSGRIDLIPLYAAQLSRKRRHQCLARILPDIRNAREQKDFVKMMQGYDIQVIHCLSEYWDIVFKASPFNDEYVHIDRYEILEPTGHDDVLWPGQRVKGEFLDLEMEPEEVALIEAVQWFNHVPDERGPTFMALTEAMKHFLRKFLLTLYLVEKHNSLIQSNVQSTDA